MDQFEMGSVVGSGNEHDEADTSNSRKAKKSYHRHNTHQIHRLETFFKDCPHPDENQRCQLGRELRLEPKQIKFWFQNKRTQTKAQNERADNSILRGENERIESENFAIREALKNVICPACGGPPFGQQERQRSLQRLQLQNAQLKEEHEKVSSLVAKYIGKPISEIEKLTTVIPLDGSSLGLLSQLGVQGMNNINNATNTDNNNINVNYNIININNNDKSLFPNYNCNYQVKAIVDMERALMAETAASAMDELVKLLRMEEPLWKKASPPGVVHLHRETYDKIFLPNHLIRSSFSSSSSSSARFESSKHSGIVAISALHLLHMFLDSDKLLDLFPTIITKAKTLQVLEIGDLGNRHGSLQLMYEEMHILSPLVASREFYFLRHCQQTEVGTWVIVDVSYDYYSKDIMSFSHSLCWRLPSGCIIQDMPNGCSKVTWVEHVQVDDKSQTHRLFRDLVCSTNIAYGAERWIVTLQRMCERFSYCSKLVENAPTTSNEFGVIRLGEEGKKSIMRLGHRMVKSFNGMLSMSGKLDFPQSTSEVNNSGVRLSVRESSTSSTKSSPGQPCGIIVSAATSLWLPLPPQTVFRLFTDHKSRLQWDILSNGYPMHEISHISTGANPGNCISILRPFIPTEKNMLVVQESCVDDLGSMVTYAPIDVATVKVAMSGEDSSNIPILPSGLIISEDGCATAASLLTVAFQILVSCASPSSSTQLDMDTVATVNTLISSTVQKIKASFNLSTLH